MEPNEEIPKLWDRLVKIEDHLKARGIDVTDEVPATPAGPVTTAIPHAPLERQAPGTTK